MPDETGVEVPQKQGLVLLDPDALEKMQQLVLEGNLGGLSQQQKTIYIIQLCNDLGINWKTRPFEFLNLQGKVVLYAKRDCTDQLRATRKLNIEILERATVGDVLYVRARATSPDGRQDEDIGAVSIRNAGGEVLANLIMKATTKAKRRVTLSHCGLGFLDESEVETIKAADGKAIGVRRFNPPELPISAGSLASGISSDSSGLDLLPPEPISDFLQTPPPPPVKLGPRALPKRLPPATPPIELK